MAWAFKRHPQQLSLAFPTMFLFLSFADKFDDKFSSRLYNLVLFLLQLCVNCWTREVSRDAKKLSKLSDENPARWWASVSSQAAQPTPEILAPHPNSTLAGTDAVMIGLLVDKSDPPIGPRLQVSLVWDIKF